MTGKTRKRRIIGNKTENHTPRCPRHRLLFVHYSKRRAVCRINGCLKSQNGCQRPSRRNSSVSRFFHLFRRVSFHFARKRRGSRQKVRSRTAWLAYCQTIWRRVNHKFITGCGEILGFLLEIGENVGEISDIIIN